MDPRLSAFLERAETVLARLEPLLPAPRPSIDWNRCLAARSPPDAPSCYLMPLAASLDLRLSATIRVDK